MEVCGDEPTMLDYIREEPGCLYGQLARARELAAPLVEGAARTGLSHLVVVASGSSNNAALCARPLMEDVLGMDVSVRTPAEFVVEGRVPAADALCLVASQSGCSTNSIEALDFLREKGRLAVGVTANPQSDFRDHADMLVDYGCGQELVGYVTKGMTGLVMFLMLAAVELARSLGRLDADRERSLRRDFGLAAEANAAMLTIAQASYETNRRAFTNLGVTYCMGYGQALGVCHEAALKLGETVKVPAVAYEADEYAHGPNLQVTPAYTLFFVSNLARGSSRMRDLFRTSAHVTDKCFWLGEGTVGGAHAIAVPEMRPAEPLLSPLFELPFFQYVAWRATEELGRWDEHPLMRETDRHMGIKTGAIKSVMPL